MTQSQQDQFNSMAVNLELDLAEALGLEVCGMWGRVADCQAILRGGAVMPRFVRDHAATFDLMIEHHINLMRSSSSIPESEGYTMVLVNGRQITLYYKDFPSPKDAVAAVIVMAVIEKLKRP